MCGPGLHVRAGTACASGCAHVGSIPRAAGWAGGGAFSPPALCYPAPCTPRRGSVPYPGFWGAVVRVPQPLGMVIPHPAGVLARGSPSRSVHRTPSLCRIRPCLLRCADLSSPAWGFGVLEAARMLPPAAGGRALVWGREHPASLGSWRVAELGAEGTVPGCARSMGPLCRVQPGSRWWEAPWMPLQHCEGSPPASSPSWAPQHSQGCGRGPALEIFFGGGHSRRMPRVFPLSRRGCRHRQLFSPGSSRADNAPVFGCQPLAPAPSGTGASPGTPVVVEGPVPTSPSTPQGLAPAGQAARPPALCAYGGDGSSGTVPVTLASCLPPPFGSAGPDVSPPSSLPFFLGGGETEARERFPRPERGFHGNGSRGSGLPGGAAAGAPAEQERKQHIDRSPAPWARGPTPGQRAAKINPPGTGAARAAGAGTALDARLPAEGGAPHGKPGASPRPLLGKRQRHGSAPAPARLRSGRGGQHGREGEAGESTKEGGGGGGLGQPRVLLPAPALRGCPEPPCSHRGIYGVAVPGWQRAARGPAGGRHPPGCDHHDSSAGPPAPLSARCPGDTVTRQGTCGWPRCPGRGWLQGRGRLPRWPAKQDATLRDAAALLPLPRPLPRLPSKWPSPPQPGAHGQGTPGAGGVLSVPGAASSSCRGCPRAPRARPPAAPAVFLAPCRGLGSR